MARFGMAGSFDFRQSGFGGLAYGTNNNILNVPMTYEQRWISLRGLYSCCLAKLEEDKKYQADTELAGLFKSTKEMLDQANRDYKPYFEGHESIDNAENNYKELLAQIFDTMTRIQAKTKMIEKEFIEEAAAA